MSDNLTSDAVMAQRAARFRQARVKRGLSQSKLAKLASIAQQTINRLERGEILYSKHLPKIAEVLGVSPNWLMYGEEAQIEVPSNQPTPAIKLVPIISWVSAGDWHEEILHPPENARLIPVPAEIASNGCYALEVKGTSMTSDQIGTKSFLDGEIIIVDPHRAPESNDFVIARQKENSRQKEKIFKQYTSDGVQKYLTALNPTFEKIEFDENKFELCGVVVAKYDYKL